MTIGSTDPKTFVEAVKDSLVLAIINRGYVDGMKSYSDNALSSSQDGDGPTFQLW